MNRTLKLVFGLAGAMAAVGSYAQVLYTSPSEPWEFICWSPGPPDNEDSKFYSTDYLVLFFENSLFGAAVGGSGTVRLGKGCYGSAINVNVAGGLGFSIGRTGSVQDGGFDDSLDLTMGMPNIPGGDFSYACTYKTTTGATPTTTVSRFGSSAIDTLIFGASDHYIIAESTQDNIRVQLRVDLLGDTARCQWTLLNQDTAAVNLGLGYGAHVSLKFDATRANDADHRLFVTVPGQKPLTIDHQYTRVGSDLSQSPPLYPMVDYANFGYTQSNAWGLQVVNSPTLPFANTGDQTPVDHFIVGNRSQLLGNVGGLSKLPSNVFNDLNFGFGIGDLLGNGVAFVQKWDPTLVAGSASGTAAASRQIVAYYRTTSAYSDYSAPYSVVVDPPRVVGTDPANVYAFAKNPGVIRVYVDNTRGFSTVDKDVSLNDIKVTLTLPAGIHDAADANRTTMTQYINVIAPGSMAFVDFNVKVDDTTYGSKSFTVTTEPNPGPTKVVSGSINVASQPRLNITNSANLVGSPWLYSDTSWSTILSPLAPDVDYQIFGWDPQQQTYVVQTSPQRGKGSFLISNVDAGYLPLGGTPRTPTDLASGAPLINLKSGWNLIANPYNYAFPLGQLVGVTASDPRRSYTFQELTDQGVISGSFAFWDTSTQSYKFISGQTDFVQPNTGYWVFVNIPQDVTLSFPAVFEPFVPAGTGGIAVSNTDWSMQVVSSQLNTGMVDDQTFIGYSKDAKATTRTTVKPPIAPVRSAIGAGLVGTAGGRSVMLAKSLTASTGTQYWDYTVQTKAAGSVRLTWPNVSTLPKGLTIRMTELGTNRTIDVRASKNYVFTAKERSSKTFRFIVSGIGR